MHKSVPANPTAWVFPGQGSQTKGMGDELFKRYPDICKKADEILGYSVERLCLDGPVKQLNQTQYTQPLLFTVCVLHYQEYLQRFERPDFVAGHSLGEYAALFSAGVIDFETGLQLVQQRGRLMSQAAEGGMAAVINLPIDQLRERLDENGLVNVDIANYNTPTQIVISGTRPDIRRASEILGKLNNTRVVPLPVSGAFHSRLMKPAREEFTKLLSQCKLSAPNIPVLSNVTARPHEHAKIAANLSRQMTHQVNWVDCIRLLMGYGVSDFVEIGPGKVLSNMIAGIREQATPLSISEDSAPQPTASRIRGESATSFLLGSQSFRDDHQVDHAYVVGSIAGGITSEAMVARAASERILAYFGASDLPFDVVEQAVRNLNARIGDTHVFGVSLAHQPENPQFESRLIELYLHNRVTRIEAIRFTRVTTALVWFRAKGLQQGPDGNIRASNKVMARVTRLDQARAFMNPAPDHIVDKLLEQGKITPDQAFWSRSMPMVDDLCIDTHGDGLGGAHSLYHLLPAIREFRDLSSARKTPDRWVRIGVAGGMGTPQALATAFMLGADFVTTLSINQASVEAGLSTDIKERLAGLADGDIGIAPVEHLFEHGAVAPAVSRGSFFPARAAKLYRLYCHYQSLEQIDHAILKELEKNYFQAQISDVLKDIESGESSRPSPQAQSLLASPRYRMLQVFKWYFRKATIWARIGSKEHQTNHALYCGASMVGFNHWARGTEMQHWKYRHVDNIAKELIDDASRFIDQGRIRSMPVS